MGKNILNEADVLPISTLMALPQIQANKFILEMVENNINFLNRVSLSLMCGRD